MLRIRIPQVLVLAISVTTAACAGPPPPVHGPTSGIEGVREISAGQTVEGTLASTDPRLEDGSHYHLYAFQGQANEEVEINLRSEEFDAYLAFGPDAGGELKVSDSDDDGAGDLNARITAVLPRSGRYLIRANSLGEGETGAYRLELVSHGEAPEPSRTEIQLGSTRPGELSASDGRTSKGSFFDEWVFEGAQDEVIRIDLTSDDFDSFVTLGTEEDGEFQSISTDDDGGDGLNSRLYTSLPAAGRYVVRATSLGAREEGAYQIGIVSEGQAGPVTREAIALEETREGELSPADARLPDGSYHDVYLYSGTAGESIQIELTSDAFDAYLQLGTEDGGNFEEIASNDDGAGDLNAKIRATLPDTREYVIRAQSLRPNQTGSYVIGVSESQPEPPASREAIGLGEVRDGALTESDPRLPSNGGRHDLWLYQGRAGETIAIDLTSEEFDTLLEFGMEHGGEFHQLDRDDDGGDGTDSRLVVTLAEDASYVIRATSFGAEQTGAYRITLSSDSEQQE